MKKSQRSIEIIEERNELPPLLLVANLRSFRARSNSGASDEAGFVAGDWVDIGAAEVESETNAAKPISSVLDTACLEL